MAKRVAERLPGRWHACWRGIMPVPATTTLLLLALGLGSCCLPARAAVSTASSAAQLDAAGELASQFLAQQKVGPSYGC